MELQVEAQRRARELLTCFRPSTQQQKIFESKASELLVFGGKRAGKSVGVSAAFASRVLGMPVTFQDGTVYPPNFPAPAPDYPRIYWIIGWDTKHIGQTIYRLLFKPGQGGTYRVIPDENTGEWITYNRADPEHAKRIKESKLAEPLIPERYLDGGYNEAFEWEDKKACQFNSCRLKNGATIYAYPSSARNPKQGDAVSGIWIDEDIQDPGHLKEWQDRLTDEEGWFMWSVWPHMKNEALLDLMNRAEIDEMSDEPQIEKIQLVMTDNPFLTDKGKGQSLGRMDSEEEVARRNRGELLTDALSMYQFNATIHQIQRPIPGQKVHHIYADAHKMLVEIYMTTGKFPEDWTRYLVIDPSNTRTACGSFVVPPPIYDSVSFGHLCVMEWEFIARRYSANQLAEGLKPKMGPRRYEGFIMDYRAGRQTHAGREDNTFQLYTDAMQKAGLQSRLSGSGFIPGCDVPPQRYAAVRSMLQVDRQSGMPQLLVVEELCPETKKEFAKYRKKTETRGESMDSVLDVPNNPRLFDCMAVIEYMAAHMEMAFLTNTAWVDPSIYAGTGGSPAYKRAMKMLAKQQSAGDDGVVTF